jgi:hypothetical protein
MHAAAEKLMASDDVKEREFGFANWMLRVTALRGCELVNAKQSWVVYNETDGRHYLDVRARPDQPYVGKSAKSGKTYTPKSRKHIGQLPLDPKLAAFLLAKDGGPDGYLFHPTGSRTSRAELLKKGHNAFVKPIIGKEDLDQGNHLLRAYVSTYIASAYDSDKKASTYLRHSTRKGQEGERQTVTQKHYIAKQFMDLPTVSDDQILAWGTRNYKTASSEEVTD